MIDDETHSSPEDAGAVLEMIRVDLEKSALTVEDIRARPLDMAERASVGLRTDTQGYVIPYFNLVGKPIPFYRVKIFNRDMKYLQLKDTPNHVYFPIDLLATLNKQKHSQLAEGTPKGYIIFTEGEKKARCATKHGFPAIAFGGVDSWRNKILLLPKGTQFSAYSYNKNLVGAKLPASGWDTAGAQAEPIALGFDELCVLIRDRELCIIIAYDSDEITAASGMRPEVQKSAAELGFELRRRGIPITKIRQLILPVLEGQQKTGLDDLLVAEGGSTYLQGAISELMARRSAFPRHPAIEDDVNKKLQNTKLGRKDIQRLALQLITDLDAKGIRMYSASEQQLYYFEEKANRLIKVDLGVAAEQMSSTPFSKLLYQHYGLSSNSDQRLMKWLSTQFSAEAPIESVSPYRVLGRQSVDEDIVRYQLNDGQYAKVTGDASSPLSLHWNGADNVLFESGTVEPVDGNELMTEFKKRQQEPLSMWWEDVLHEVRLKSHGKAATLFSLLYYISPWLHRWRGSQLPSELVIGEAGSGKAQNINTPVRTPTGWKLMGNLKIGDIVCTPTGTAKILALHPQGTKQTYKVTFNDVSTNCCIDHLWNVQPEFRRFKKEPFYTKSLAEIMQQPLVMANKHKPRNYIPVSGIPGTHQDLPIKPYTMGVLLGDGSFRDYTPDIASHPDDAEIIDRVRSEGYSLTRIGKFRYNLTGIGHKPFKALNLDNKLSGDKHIPGIYLDSSLEQRVALLQGLMDTDGTAGTSCVFNTSSPQLARDVQRLVCSLGGTCCISERTAPQRAGHLLAYNLAIRLPLDIEPFYLARKKHKMSGRQQPLRYIKKIEPLEMAECVCITLDDPNGLYLTENYIVTHNSTLCELRLTILTGQPNLRNAPADIKDWHASIVNTGGLHVTDNVQLVDKSLKQRLSDEICRLITEPEPHIEMRKYYTNADLMRIRVDAVFVFTAILQPFQNSDLLQRSIIIELDKMAKNSSTTTEDVVKYDSRWKQAQLDKFGGRTAWISHHLHVLHKFFELVKTDWDENYKAKHRLINLEQSLMLMAKLFGLESKWIPDYLASQITDSVVEADWCLEGVRTFANVVNKAHRDGKLVELAQYVSADVTRAKEMKFSANAIAQWAMQHEAFQECQNLTNSRRLGRYLQTHKAMIAQTCAVVEDGTHNNKTMYRVKLSNNVSKNSTEFQDSKESS